MESSNGWNVGFWGKMNEEMLISRYPVHRACRDGDHEALSTILLHGKPDNHDELYGEDQFYGWTPVHWAAYYGKLECLQMLVRAGVSIDIATQRFHQSPIHVAAFGGQPHCVMWLLQNGANVNAQDYLGETPSHKAARSGSMECLGILKANGAQFIIKNNNGHVPKDLAVSCGNESSARYIMQVEQTNEMNGSSQLINGGLCHRKRGNSELDEDDVKKARGDPSMPFGSPITEMNQEFCVPDNLCSDSTELMSNGHSSIITPNGLSTQNNPSVITNGTSSLHHVVNGTGDAPHHALQSPPTPSSSPTKQPPKKEYIRVYDYMTNWSAAHSESSCETRKTIVTQEMECQDAEMMDADDNSNVVNGGAVTNNISSNSNSAQEHKQSIVVAQGYDSKLCEAMYDVSYGHAY